VREYELTFIIQPEISDEGIAATCERLEGILQKSGAHKLFYDDMGKRRLGFPIRRFQKGHYLTLFFLDEGKAVTEVERSLKLDDSILRYLTVLANERVADIEARKAEAAEFERQRAERAAERAAREAEDAARAAEEEATRAAEEAAAQAARQEADAAEAARQEAEAAEASAAPEEADAGDGEQASDAEEQSSGEAQEAAPVADEAGAEVPVAKEG
jgi:small subunit ribosomal protein S6